MLARGLRKRCPRCASGGVFRSFFDLHQRCPGCGHRFQREPGYWVGAMIIITVITFGLFLLVFVGGMVLTWPDVPWNLLAVVTILANLVVPAALYPVAKTLWVALELGWNPLEPEEATEAARNVRGD